MSRYIERDSELEVDVTCVMSYRGEPYAAIVTMPDGLRYSLPADRVDFYFELIPNQTIVLEAVVGGHKHDRSGTMKEVVDRMKADGDEIARKLRIQAEGLVAELDQARAERDALQQRKKHLEKLLDAHGWSESD